MIGALRRWRNDRWRLRHGWWIEDSAWRCYDVGDDDTAVVE